MKLSEFLNDDTCQIFLAIIVGIVICYFIFGSCSTGCSRRDGFSVGGQSCDVADIAAMEGACCGGNYCDEGEVNTCTQECANVYLPMHQACMAAFQNPSIRSKFNTLNTRCQATNAESQLDEGQIRTRRERELFRDVHRFAVDLLTPLAQSASFTRSATGATDLTDVENDLIRIDQLVDLPGQGSAVVDDAEYPILLSTLQKYGVYVLYFDNSDIAGAYSDTDHSVIASLLNNGRMRLKSFDDQDTIAYNHFGDVFSATALINKDTLVEDLKELSDNVRPLPEGLKVDPFSEIFVTDDTGRSLYEFSVDNSHRTLVITPTNGSFTMRGTPLTNELLMIGVGEGSPVTPESINTALTSRLNSTDDVTPFTSNLRSLASLDASKGKIMAVIPDPSLNAISITSTTTPYKITVELPSDFVTIQQQSTPNSEGVKLLSSDFSNVSTNEFMLAGYDGLSANKQAYTVPIETTETGYNLDSMKESMAKNYRNAQYLAIIAAIGVRRNEEKIPKEIDFMSNTLIDSSNQSVVVERPSQESECLVSGGFYMANYLLDTSANGKVRTMILQQYLRYIGRNRADFVVDLTVPTITDNTTGVVYTGDANNFFYMPPNGSDGKKVIVVTLTNSDIVEIKTREAAYDRAEADRGYTCREWESDARLLPGGACPPGQRLTPERSESSLPAFLDDGVTPATHEVFCCSEQACDCGSEPTAAEFSSNSEIGVHNSCCGFRNDWDNISRLLTANGIDNDYYFNTAIQNDDTRNLLQRCCPQPGSIPGDGTFPFSASTIPPTENCNSRYSTDECGGGQ